MKIYWKNQITIEFNIKKQNRTAWENLPQMAQKYKLIQRLASKRNWTDSNEAAFDSLVVKGCYRKWVCQMSISLDICPHFTSTICIYRLSFELTEIVYFFLQIIEACSPSILLFEQYPLNEQCSHSIDQFCQCKAARNICTNVAIEAFGENGSLMVESNGKIQKRDEKEKVEKDDDLEKMHVALSLCVCV